MSAEYAGLFDFDLDPRSENSSTKKRPFPLKVRRNPADSDLEEALSSALLAGDKELEQVVHRLESISRNLQSGKGNCQTQRLTSEAVVWNEVKQTLVERGLRNLALSDDLTCLYNRRGFYAAATHQLKIAHRNKQPTMLLFCDVDGLKGINDTFGHREGDHALVCTADALEVAFRESDVLARLGGDEFAVLATDLSQEDLPTILRRLDKSLGKASKDELQCQLSLSVGAASVDPDSPVSLGDLMESADRAMYEEKRRRTDRTEKAKTMIHRVGGRGTSDAITFVERQN
ncbi:MAG TPA: GGDEF domain-containing protein [Candidatus Dormibacteraeota bacterium]|nr:GGDEF domain-containing protein [Candidatus Dormibacteraeota bacterium]